MWDLADFDATTIGGLLSLGPGNVTISPTTSPYFSYPRPDTLRVQSRAGSTASIVFNTSVPAQYTLEAVIRFSALPRSGADLAGRSAGFTVADGSGRGLSLYFTASGISVSRVDDFGSAVLTPDSSEIVQEANTTFLTIRVAADSALGRAYIYLGEGETDFLSHAYTVPISETPPSVTDLFELFATGTASEPVDFELRRLRLSSSLIIPDFLPIADAGEDQVAPVGKVIRLDGRRSYDAEGSPLSYLWRVIDAPFGSAYAAELSSGNTTDDGDVDGVTDILSFPTGALPAWVTAGDILRIGDAILVIDTVDNAGGQLTITTDSLSDSITATPFRIIRQSLLVGADTETPYAVPDTQGIYRFQLIVNDGHSSSEASEVLTSIVGARAPFGVEPDVSFLWQAIGDEWAQVENRDLFEEFWTGMAQLMSGKLLEAWQYHYNLSIRDAQPYFQRKWVPYYTLLPETAPAEATFSMRYGFLRAAFEFESGLPSVTGGTLSVEYFTGQGLTDTEVVEISLVGSSLSSIVSSVNAALVGTGIRAKAAPVMVDSGAYRVESTGALSGTTLTFTPGTLPSWVTAGSFFAMAGHRALVVSANNGLGELEIDTAPVEGLAGTWRVYRACRLVLESPTRGFWINPTAASTSLGFDTETVCSLSGLEGAVATGNTYMTEGGVDLSYLGVVRDDTLVLNNGQSFRIDRTLSGLLDPFPNQRLLLSSPLPLDASAEWDIGSNVVSTSLDFDRGLVYPGDVVRFEIFDTTTSVVSDARGIVLGVRGNRLSVYLEDLYGAVLSPSRYEVRLIGVRRRKAIPLEEHTVSVPQLQDKIPVDADPTILRENLDYVLEPFYRDTNEAPILALQFRDETYVGPDEEPPDVLWAELTLFDNAPNVENLHGELAGFYRDDAAAFGPGFNYIAATGGILYSYLRGPTPEATRIGAQILLGQVFSEAKGIILEIRDDFSPTRGRILVQDAEPPQSEVVRTYYYRKRPVDLSPVSGLADNPATGLPWAEGDTINQYDPIGSGVDILDTKNDPDWYVPFVRSRMITEVEKFMTYLVQFDLDVVSLVNLQLLLQFVTKARPTYAYPLLVGVRYHDDEIDVVDEFSMNVTLNLYDSVCGSGLAYMYDDFRGDGSVWSSHDDGNTFYDALIDCPTDIIEFCMTMAWAGGPITFDTIFFLDTEVTDLDGVHTGIPGSTFTPTYDMTLPAGDYRVCAMIKSGSVVLP